MAPIKFEEDIKNSLENRRIQPSKNIWGELEKALDKNSDKSKKRPFWWMGIAASIIGIFWISISFFNQEKVIVKPTVVEVSNDNIDIPMNSNVNQKADKILKEDVIIDKSNATTNPILVVVEIPSKKIKKETVSKIEPFESQEIEQEILIAKSEVEIPEKILEEEKQLQEVAAQVAALEKENATDAEIDNLLKNAQKKMADKKFTESGMSVSAYALLFEVEEELDPTFKEKVFNLLSENYHSVKNAVAQRND